MGAVIVVAALLWMYWTLGWTGVSAGLVLVLGGVLLAARK